MIVRVGAEELARVKLGPTRARHDLRLALPKAARGGLVQLQFDFPHAQREPNSPRQLGLFLHEIGAEVETADEAA
jgi:hypothetical protein